MNAIRRATSSFLVLVAEIFYIAADGLGELSLRVSPFAEDFFEEPRVGPYDGPNQGVTVLVGQEDGTNVPSTNSRTMPERFYD